MATQPLPYNDPAGAADLVTGCIARWDTGGREELYSALLDAFRTIHQQSSPEAARPFVYLWRSLIFSHALAPRLNQSAFQSLLDALILEQRNNGHAPSQTETHGISEDSNKLSAGPSKSPEGGEETCKTPASLADLLLDIIWAVDQEIDIRKDVADSMKVNDLFSLAAEEEPKGKSKKKATPAEEAKAARSRLAELLRGLITSQYLARESVAERLDIPLLAAVGLVTDEAVFNKKGIRINTANLYKQQKFNLLREENEGYSGLINELLGGMGPEIVALYAIPFEESHNWHAAPTRIVEQERPEERNRRARKVMRNISALIGYFDLDPNRVLDIVLDVFASNVGLHWPFFIALLSASPWARGRQQRSRRSPGTMEEDFVPPVQFASLQIDPGSGLGSSTCAQLLGFKFDYYRLSDTREEVPTELYTMSALLIKENFVRFADIWPHLSPDESGMKALEAQYTASLKAKAASARGNALSMAAPLADDDESSTKSEVKKQADAETVREKEPPNQIVGLLNALLSLGQLEHALFILGLFPWLLGAFEDTSELFFRLVKEILRPLYSTISRTAGESPMADEFVNAPRMRFDVRRQALVSLGAPRLLPTSSALEPLSTSQHRFVFAFGELWKTHLPRCRDDDSFFALVMPLLRLGGVHLYRDLELFQQLCRLGASRQAALGEGAGEKSSWLDLVRFHLFPSLSLTSENSGLLYELWGLLSKLPFQERFSLYGEWKADVYKRPEVRYRQLETEKEAKGILKRISKDNLKLSGRALARASHANPLIFFNIALNQVQVYDNMIPHIVECAKYLTALEYDVFSFNLIEALSNPEKQRTKQDGTNISLWLKSLASFTGTLYKRYAMMNPTPVLQYIANQLKADNSKDLVIVRELILKMSGIEPLANLADKQIAALSGGRLLRMEAMMAVNTGPGTPARQALKKSSARLMATLRESHLAVALLLLIAQQRQVCVHLVPEEEAHLRYLGNLADSCQEVLFQYVEFLHSQLEPAAYAELIPDLKALCVRFSIEPAIAFHIARPRLLFSIKQTEDKKAEQRLRASLLASKQKVKVESNGDRGGEAPSGSEDVEMKDESPEIGSEPISEAVTAPNGIWNEGLFEAITAAQEILPEEVKMVLTPHFFATFWQLSLADIQVPSERYEQEMKIYQQLIKDAESADTKKTAALTRHQDVLEQLRAELKARMLAHGATRQRLAVEKNHWFPDNEGLTRATLVQQLLQHCIVPRALLSPTDAIFAAKFIRLMHINGARNFSSLTLYDRIFIEHIAPVVFSSTENEANSYARFLQVVLEELMPWYKNPKTFAAEVYGDNLPGFQLRWAERRGGENIPKEALCSYEQFKIVMHKWHDRMRDAFKLCLTSGDFMRIRNAIAVMNRIAQNFPLFDGHGRDLLQVVDKLVVTETRGSLKVLGQGLLATLKKRQPEWLGKAAPARKKDTAPALKGPPAEESAVKEAASETASGEGKDRPETAAIEAVEKDANATQEQASDSKAATAKDAEEPLQDMTLSDPPKGARRPSEMPSRQPADQANSSNPPSGPSRKQRNASTVSSPPTDSRATPSQPSQRVSANGQSAREEQKSLPVRPETQRNASNAALPARPRGEESNADRRGPSQGQSQKASAAADDRVPTGPRGSIREAPAREAQSREATGAEADATKAPSTADTVAINAARQAALSSMNSPRNAAGSNDAPKSSRNEPSANDRGDRVDASRNGPASRKASPSRTSRTAERGGRSSTNASRDVSPRAAQRSRDEDVSTSRARDRAGVETGRGVDREERNDRRGGRDQRAPADDRDRDNQRNRDRAREWDDRRRDDRNDPRRIGNDRAALERDRERERDRDRDRDRERDRNTRSYRDERDAVDARQRPDKDESRGARPSAVDDRNDRTDGRSATVEQNSAAAYQRRRDERGAPNQDARDRSAEQTRSRELFSSASRGAPTGPRDLPIRPVSGRRDDERIAAPAATSAAPATASGGGDSPAAGLKRTLADRLSSQDGSASPSPGQDPRGGDNGDRGGPSEGPDPKRAKINRNRFSGSGRPGGGGEDGDASFKSQSDPRTPTGPSGPMRSVSISGSAARERERRETERERDRGPTRGGQGEREGSGRGGGGGGDGGRRPRGGRREEERYKDRSRRRAGED